MRGNNPFYHGKPQSGTASVTPGRVHLIKAIPDFRKGFRGNANAIVNHLADNPAFGSAEHYPDGAALFAIFDAVRNQIDPEPHKEGLIYIGVKIRCDFLMNCDPALFCQGFLFQSHHAGDVADIDPFKIQFCRSSIRPGRVRS